MGSKVVAMVLMIAMVGCGSSVHGDVEVEWKCCCAVGSNGIGFAREEIGGAGVTSLDRIGRPEEMVSAFCSLPHM